jgi:hypothetical protein
MTERENFLERWSRRKDEAQREAKATPQDQAPVASPQADDPAARAPQPAAPMPQPASTGETPFDVTSLPSIDSITAATDVRAFLNPGVPADLTRAALRRAWTADPAIRDFRGLQENDWDFNDPNGVPGFGQFAPGEDIKKLIAQVFGEPEASTTDPAKQEAAAQTPPDSAPVSEALPQAELEPDRGTERDDPDAEIVRRNDNAASQDKIAQIGHDSPRSARKHGSALPE